MARKQTVQTTEQLQAAVAEIKTVAAKKTRRGTTTPKPAQTGLAEAASSLSEDDSIADQQQATINTMVAKFRAAVEKAEQAAQENAELFGYDDEATDLAVASARKAMHSQYRKQRKEESCPADVRTAINRYFDSLAPVVKADGKRGRKISFNTKVGQSYTIQINSAYSQMMGWAIGDILEIICDTDSDAITLKRVGKKI